MLSLEDADRHTTSARLPVSPSTLSGINRIAVQNARYLLAQNSLAAANDATDPNERERHLQVARALSR